MVVQLTLRRTRSDDPRGPFNRTNPLSANGRGGSMRGAKAKHSVKHGRVLVVVLAAGLVAAACGGGSGKKSATPTSAPVGEESTTTTALTTETTTPTSE